MNPQVAARFRAQAREVDALCHECGVERLELFGSGTREDWRSGESDLDLLVRFRVPSRRGIADDYLRLATGLEAALGCRVDLLTEGALKSPHFQQAIEPSRETVYAG